jgi:hypothetical protein
MNKPLYSIQASAHLELLKPQLRSVLIAFNDLRFSVGQEEVNTNREILEVERGANNFSEEQYLNDMFVLTRYIDLFSEYGKLWESICNQNFSDSWNALQNALDLLRLIKKFSEINIQFFENQLTELERMYPYNVFFSIGATVELFECSICGRNIDSVECSHMQGNLYGGVMAYAIARNIAQLDHISMVKYPEDKRCVVSYEDVGEQFKLVRFLSSLIKSRKFRISDFGRLQFSKRNIPNPDYEKLGRNDLCFCGSGKKFKKCCIKETHAQGDHVDIVAVPACIEHAVI